MEFGFDRIISSTFTIVDQFSSFMNTFFSTSIGELFKDNTSVIPDSLEALTLFELLFGAGFLVVILMIFIRFVFDLWPV